MATLTDIEKSTKDYSEARRSLSDKVRDLEDQITAIKRRYLPGIRRAVETASEKQAILKAAIEESAGLFVKPRTVIFHGVKVGFEKGKGKIEWDNDEQVIKLIKKHFSDQSDVLIKTTEKPVKKALAQLTVAELKKLGIEVDETIDQVVIRSMDSEIDKMVNALLKDEEIEEEAVA